MFDANLSRRLVGHLVDVYPGSEHASVLGSVPEDIEIWDYAKAHGLVVVTKDSDFYRMSMAWGPPPKVVWLRLGNGGTVEVAKLLRLREGDLRLFGKDPTVALLIVGAP
jgi:predicted nuclease of predicted toxin-antitoxin system